MGQCDPSNGGSIHLVETPEDVAKLQIRQPDRIAFVTQTTLSMDDTSKIIDALRMRFPQVHGPRKDDIDRKSVVSGKSVSVRVDLGGRRIIKKNNNNQEATKAYT